MRFKILLLPVATCIAAAVPAQAQQCSPSAIIANQIGDDDYDPGDAQEQIIQLRLANTEDCVPNSVVLSPAQSSQFRYQFRGSQLPITLADSAVLVASSPTSISLSPVGLRALADRGTLDVDLFEVAPGQFAPAGTYENDIRIELDGSRVANVRTIVSVSPTVQLLGEAATGSIGLELGRLENGASGTYSIFTRSNGSLSLNVRSENEARLIHERGVSFGFIRYSARINGVETNLSSAREIGLGFAPGQLTETVFQVEVPAPRRAYAGTYRDTLVFSFTAN